MGEGGSASCPLNNSTANKWLFVLSLWRLRPSRIPANTRFTFNCTPTWRTCLHVKICYINNQFNLCCLNVQRLNIWGRDLLQIIVGMQFNSKPTAFNWIFTRPTSRALLSGICILLFSVPGPPESPLTNNCEPWLKLFSLWFDKPSFDLISHHWFDKPSLMRLNWSSGAHFITFGSTDTKPHGYKSNSKSLQISTG